MRRRVLLSAAAAAAAARVADATGAPLARASDAAGAVTEITLALMPYSGTERRQFEQWVERFNAENAGVRARIVAMAPESYKSSLSDRLRHDPDGADLYYWFAGTRLRELAAQGLVAPLDDVWRSQNLRQAFNPALESVVSWRQHPFAVPLNYYQWGFYYRRSFFDREKLSPPATWTQMQALATASRARGIAPTVLGLGDPWASASWFDFLDLRLNGLDFHLAVTSGSVPFSDARVRAVFAVWREVRDQGWYLPEALPLGWREAAPYLLHGRAATFLMGNFFESALPDSVRNDMGFFPFPRLRDDMPDYEEGPTDVLMMSARARHPAGAAAFLAWTCRPEIQLMLAAPYGKLPTHRAVALPADPLARAGGLLLRDAAGLAQYFDRDSSGALAQAGLAVFNRFVAGKLDVDGALAELEAARRHSPGPS